jgi:hypothetical protein
MERDHLGNPVIDGRIIFKMDLQEVRCWGMGWIELALGRDIVVNAVISLWIP